MTRRPPNRPLATAFLAALLLAAPPEAYRAAQDVATAAGTAANSPAIDALGGGLPVGSSSAAGSSATEHPPVRTIPTADPVIRADTAAANSPAGYSSVENSPTGNPASADPAETDRLPVRIIPIDGPAARADAEISALAVRGSELILVPQYPDRGALSDRARLFHLPLAEIEAYLDDRRLGPLHPRELPVDGLAAVKARVPGWEGFEALAVRDGEAVLSIESSRKGRMRGHLVRGRFADGPNGPRLALDPASLTELPVPRELRNKSFEALLPVDGGVLAVFEENAGSGTATALRVPPPGSGGPGVPVAEPFPALPWRVTDATEPDPSAPDADAVSWVLGLCWPPERMLGGFGVPEEAPGCPQGAVEELIPLVRRAGRFERAPRPPVRLAVPSYLGRNWEGLAILPGRGFLLATDRHPATMLGFAAYPEAAARHAAPERSDGKP